jgi:DNA polymerase-3 subunit epsilon
VDFLTIDVETANADMASICQIGIAKYCNGTVEKEWCSLVNPEDYFSPINIMIHGITEEDVGKAPTFPEIAGELQELMQGNLCVCHTHFDRVSLSKAFARYNLRSFECEWLDSARVARRAWKEFAYSGYGLANLTSFLGYEFQHHDALEDAKAAGFVLLSAIKHSGIALEDWPIRVTRPLYQNASTKSHYASVRRDGNSEGELYGEQVCFTGSLVIARAEAADVAANAGCNVSGITKETTILVVGDQDIAKLAGNTKSSKHRRAEEMIATGQKIRILKESDFFDLVESSVK